MQCQWKPSRYPDDSVFKSQYPGGLFNLVKKLVRERKEVAVAEIVYVAEIVNEAHLPIKKRKRHDIVRKPCKKAKYYVDTDDDAFRPKYRVTLYDKFRVLDTGKKPGRTVTLKSWCVDVERSLIVWHVANRNETWEECEDNLVLV